MQFSTILAAITLAITASATPVSPAGPFNNVTQIGSCYQYSGSRSCAVAGDRVLTCLDYEAVCPVGYSSPHNATTTVLNQLSCAGKPEGTACDALWTCCPHY